MSLWRRLRGADDAGRSAGSGPNTGGEQTAERLPEHWEDAWQVLRSRHLGVSLARQRRLEAQHAADTALHGDWSVDLTDGTARIGETHTRLQVLLNASDTSDTSMLAPAFVRLNGASDALTAAFDRARAAIKADPATLPITHPLERDTLPYELLDPVELASVLTVLAGAAPMYRGPHPSGALYFTLEDLTDLPLLATPTVITTLADIAGLGVRDSRAASTTLLRSEGFALEATEHEPQILRGRRPSRTGTDVIRVRFDELWRIADVQGELMP